jgi:hypothetical protein
VEAQCREKLFTCEVAPFDQQIHHPTTSGLMFCGKSRKILRPNQVTACQDLSQSLLERLIQRIGGDHFATQERDADDLLLALNRQDSGSLVASDRH